MDDEEATRMPDDGGGRERRNGNGKSSRAINRSGEREGTFSKRGNVEAATIRHELDLGSTGCCPGCGKVACTSDREKPGEFWGFCAR